jgi:hypothetical protein
MPHLVQYDADAVIELAALTAKAEKKALFNVVDKLRILGPKLVPPHMKSLKGEAGLLELRPKQGKTHVRAIYRRVGDDFVILAICVKPDKADWDAALGGARERAPRYDP